MTPAKCPNIEIIERGACNTENYRVYYANADTNVAISPWHDIPYFADAEKNIFHMVVEIPRWTNAKMRIATKDFMNPIKQDMRKGALRYVKNVFPHHGYPWNYGAIPQTWENPEVVNEETSHKGDDDPIDACEIGSKVHRRGAVIKVKILGCYALIDDGQTDWKLIVVDVNDPLSEKLNDLNDVERLLPGLLSGTREWFRVYKVLDDKPHNKFAFNDEPKGRDFALKILQHSHEQWKDLVSRDREENKTGLNLRNSTNQDTPNKIQNPESLLVNMSAFSPGPNLSISELYEINKWHYPTPLAVVVQADVDKIKPNDGRSRIAVWLKSLIQENKVALISVGIGNVHRSAIEDLDFDRKCDEDKNVYKQVRRQKKVLDKRAAKSQTEKELSQEDRTEFEYQVNNSYPELQLALLIKKFCEPEICEASDPAFTELDEELMTAVGFKVRPCSENAKRDGVIVHPLKELSSNGYLLLVVTCNLDNGDPADKSDGNEKRRALNNLVEVLERYGGILITEKMAKFCNLDYNLGRTALQFDFTSLMNLEDTNKDAAATFDAYIFTQQKAK